MANFNYANAPETVGHELMGAFPKINQDKIHTMAKWRKSKHGETAGRGYYSWVKLMKGSTILGKTLQNSKKAPWEHKTFTRAKYSKNLKAGQSAVGRTYMQWVSYQGDKALSKKRKAKALKTKRVKALKTGYASWTESQRVRQASLPSLVAIDGPKKAGIGVGAIIGMLAVAAGGYAIFAGGA